MTQTIAPFVISPELTGLEARSICEAIHTAEGKPGICAAGPGMNWITTLEAMLASPLGQAALKMLEGFVTQGLLKPNPAVT
jgi:hypothetical protein